MMVQLSALPIRCAEVQAFPVSWRHSELSVCIGGIPQLTKPPFLQFLLATSFVRTILGESQARQW